MTSSYKPLGSLVLGVVLALPTASAAEPTLVLDALSFFHFAGAETGAALPAGRLAAVEFDSVPSGGIDGLAAP